MSVINHQYRSELDDMELLLYKAIHCINEPFELFFDVAQNAGFFILSYLPQHESATFFEAMINSAEHQSKKQYGVMLASLGAVLEYNDIHIAEACKQYQKAFVVLEPLGDSMELAWLYTHVGFTWSRKGMYKRAARNYEDAKCMLQQELSRLELREIETIQNPKYKTALHQEQRRGKQILSVTFSLFGMLHKTTGNFQSAIYYHEKALHIRRRLYGLHPTLGQGYNNICLVYEKTGNYKKAKEYCMKGLHLKSMLVPRNSNTILVSLLNLAKMTYMYEGNVSTALRLFEDAYKIREALGLNHLLTSVIWMRKGELFLNLEKYPDAADCFNKAVDGLLETGGHPQMRAEALLQWGIALKKTGNLTEAEQRLRLSLKISEKVAQDNGTAEEEIENFKDALRELSEVRELAQSK